MSEGQMELFGSTPVRKEPEAPKVTGVVVLDAEPDAEPEGTRRCSACHQTIKKLNPHRMDQAKVRVLLDMALLEERRRHRVERGVPGGQRWVLAKAGDELVVLSDDGGMKTIDHRTTSYRAREHASRLFWFGLLEYAGKRTGAFRLNKAGYDFIAGRLTVPSRIWCREGEVIERDEGSVSINDVKDVTLSAAYWDGYAEWQSYRE